MKYTDVRGLLKMFPISRSQVYQMVEQGEIPFYRFGKRSGSKIVFDVAEVEEWLTNRETIPTEEKLLSRLKTKFNK